MGIRLRQQFLFLIFCLIGGLLMSQDIRLRFPVKWLDDKPLAAPPIPETFELSINGLARKVQEVVEYRDVLKTEPILKRNFVLGFHIIEYTPAISGAVAYFVYQILNPGDHLIIISPLKSHYIVAGGNKERIITNIGKFLKAECESFRQFKMTSEKKLKSMLDKLNQVMVDDSRSSDYNVQRFKDINMFLNIFPVELNKYCQTYLIPRANQYDRILKQFSTRGGTRWWIHFHQRGAGDILAATIRMIKRIKEYFKDSVSHFSRMISSLENELKYTDSFHSGELLDVMLEENVCYHVIFFGGYKNNQQQILRQNESDLIQKMGAIARDCGGRLEVTIDPGEGIKRIEAHVYSYVELVVPFDDRIEPKSIRLNWKNQNRLIYKKEYTVGEIAARLNFLKNECLLIQDFLKSGNRISFSLTRFKKDEKAQVGVLNVQISMRDRWGKIQYQRERTLRATKDRVDLSIELPPTDEKFSEVKISVVDLVANNQVVLEKSVSRIREH